MNSSQCEVLQKLARSIRAIESSWQPRAAISLGIPALDDLLSQPPKREPEKRRDGETGNGGETEKGGAGETGIGSSAVSPFLRFPVSPHGPSHRFPVSLSGAGSLVELLSAADGAGVWTLALLMAGRACGEQKVLVVADVQRCFYPVAAAKLGVDGRRLLVLRPPRQRDVCLAVNQALRCSAVGAVIGWYDQLRTLDFRRLQLAAETGGGVGFLLRPARALREPSFAAIRLLVKPIGVGVPLLASKQWHTRRVQVEVVRCRGGKYGQSVILEIDDETGHVHVPAGVASPAARTRPARASG